MIGFLLKHKIILEAVITNEKNNKIMLPGYLIILGL